jgi:aryl-alcohol dehydrogenase-like predicted oxidoreductase
MRYGTLGGSALAISRVGLGCNNFGGVDRPLYSNAPVARIDLPASRAVVDTALDAGITFLDTADFYGQRGGAEEIMGEVLVGRRDRVVLATKFGEDMGDGTLERGRPEYVRWAVEGSLKRLQTDWIDLYYYHRPDGATPLADTIGVLGDLVREGRVREIGISNMKPAQVEECAAAGARDGNAPVRALQNNFSLLAREHMKSVLPRCHELGIGSVPFFPLAGGLLTGKYRRGEPLPDGSRLGRKGDPIPDAQWDVIEALEGWAADHGRSLLELAIAALVSTPGVSSVIAGATNPAQVRANAAAADWELSGAELAEVHALLDEIEARGTAGGARQ